MSTYLNEIIEQPDALMRLFDTWASSSELKELATKFRSNPRRLVFVGMGSSNFAPHALRTRLSQANIPFRILEAGELLHYEMTSIDRDDWIIAISQSGESYETKVVAERLKGKVERIVVITNEAQGALSKLGDHVLLLHAGHEVGSTTKTFLNTILAIHLLVDALTDHRFVTEEAITSLTSDIRNESSRMQGETQKMRQYLEIAPDRSPHPIHIVTRGPSLATAYQSALILAETTDLYVSAFAGGTFRHGPYELSGPQHRAIFFAPSGPTQDLIINMAREVHELGSKVVLIGDNDGDFPFYHLRLPQIHEWFSPILYFLPMEFFGYNTALFRGREPGMMRNMGKVTNME